MTLTAPIEEAITVLRQAFPHAQLGVREDGSEGAYVLLDTVNPGSAYVQRETWVGFNIVFSYPHADAYPHFVRPDRLGAASAARILLLLSLFLAA